MNENDDGTWIVTKKVVAPFAIFEFTGHPENYAEFISKLLLRQFPSLNLFVIQCSYVSIEFLWVVRFSLVKTPSAHDTDDWSLFTELAAIANYILITIHHNRHSYPSQPFAVQLGRLSGEIPQMQPERDRTP